MVKARALEALSGVSDLNEKDDLLKFGIKFLTQHPKHASVTQTQVENFLNHKMVAQPLDIKHGFTLWAHMVFGVEVVSQAAGKAALDDLFSDTPEHDRDLMNILLNFKCFNLAGYLAKLMVIDEGVYPLDDIDLTIQFTRKRVTPDEPPAKKKTCKVAVSGSESDSN